MTPTWVWCIIAGLGGFMVGFAIADSLAFRDIQRLIAEQTKRCNDHIDSMVKRTKEGK